MSLLHLSSPSWFSALLNFSAVAAPADGPATGDDTGPALPVNGNPNDVSNFVTSILINGLLGLFLIFLFLVFRRRIGWIYAPRINAHTRKSDFPPPPIGERLFDCFSVALTTSQSTILKSAGPDALIFARFFQLCSILFLVATLLGVVLLVVNTQGGAGKRAFEAMSITNIDHGSPTLVLHALIAWIINLLALYLMFRAWIGWVTIRHAYLSNIHRQDQNLTILAQNVPKRARSDEALSDYFARLYPLNFHSAVIVKDTRKLQLIIERRDYYQQRLEHAYGVWAETGERPKASEQKSEAERWVDSFLCSHHCHALTGLLFYPLRGEVDAIEYYTYKLRKYNALVQQEQQRVDALRPGSAGFISFKTALVTNTAVRVEHNPRPFQYQVKPAPLVHDVYWPALLLSRKSRLLRSAVVNAVIALSFFFWAIPMAAIQSLSNLDYVTQRVAFLRPLYDAIPQSLLPVVQGYLPSLGLMLLILILPDVLLWLTRQQGVEAHSWQQLSLLHKYFLFQIFIFFIFNALSKTLYQASLREWQDKTATAVLSDVAVGFTSVAPFFINFIMLRALTGFPNQLARLWPLILGTVLLRYRCKTEREKREVQKPPTIAYGEEYPEHMLVFTIGVTYAVIAPVVLPFVYLYFFLGYITKVYQTLYMYVPRFESGGMYWPPVFQRLTASLLLSQVTLIGIFGLMDSSACSAMMLPLPVITWACNYYVWSAYWEKGRHLPVEIAEAVDRERNAELEKSDASGKVATPKHEYEGEELAKAVGSTETQVAVQESKEGTADALEVEEAQSARPSLRRHRSTAEDEDAIQRSDQDIKKKAKRQDRNSRAWGDNTDISAPTPSAATTAMSVNLSLPDDKRVSLHPPKLMLTGSVTERQQEDRRFKRTLHPYTQPELLAPILVLPDLDTELRIHTAFAQQVNAAIESEYARSPSPFAYDEEEKAMMERETRREDNEREKERRRRARRRGQSLNVRDELAAAAADVPASVQTALLSTPHHRQVNYSGEAERRGWPSISLNVNEEWGGSDDEDDDI